VASITGKLIYSTIALAQYELKVAIHAHLPQISTSKAKGCIMELSEYFENNKGIGVFSTADGRPHFMDEQTVVFIAADRLTHANLQTNPHAVYLFKEYGRYKGQRLYLTNTREEKDSPLIDEIRRKKYKGV
jgi:hypothetical protein